MPVNAEQIRFANTVREWRLKIELYGLPDCWGDLSNNKTSQTNWKSYVAF